MRLKQWLRMERESLARGLASRMAYRLDFAISILAMFLAYATSAVFVLVIYDTTQGFPGWSFSEVLMIIGYITAARGLASMIFMGVLWNTIRNVKQGLLDTLLLAPQDPLAYLINRSVDVEDIGLFASGLTMLGFGMAGADVNVATALLLLAFFPLAVGFFAALAIIMSALAIRFVETFRLYEIIHILMRFGEYPLTIFPKTLAWALLIVMPIAAVGYVPIAVGLGKATPLLLLSAAAVVMFVIGAIKYWKHTLASYASAGG